MFMLLSLFLLCSRKGGKWKESIEQKEQGSSTVVTAFYFLMTNITCKTTCDYVSKNIFETFPHLTNVLKKSCFLLVISSQLFEIVIGKLPRKAGMHLAECNRAALP